MAHDLHFEFDALVRVGHANTSNVFIKRWTAIFFRPVLERFQISPANRTPLQPEDRQDQGDNQHSSSHGCDREKYSGHESHHGWLILAGALMPVLAIPALEYARNLAPG